MVCGRVKQLVFTVYAQCSLSILETSAAKHAGSGAKKGNGTSSSKDSGSQIWTGVLTGLLITILLLGLIIGLLVKLKVNRSFSGGDVSVTATSDHGNGQDKSMVLTLNDRSAKKYIGSPTSSEDPDIIPLQQRNSTSQHLSTCSGIGRANRSSHKVVLHHSSSTGLEDRPPPPPLSTSGVFTHLNSPNPPRRYQDDFLSPSQSSLGPNSGSSHADSTNSLVRKTGLTSLQRRQSSENNQSSFVQYKTLDHVRHPHHQINDLDSSSKSSYSGTSISLLPSTVTLSRGADKSTGSPWLGSNTPLTTF